MCTRKRVNSKTLTTSKYFKKQKNERDVSGNKFLTENFYANECTQMAKSLLGQTIVRCYDNQRITCKIVEAEAYLARDDKASHSFNSKQTKRNKAMFMKPGTLYVYMTYGMYCCMNISVGDPGDAVLIRAVEPIEGANIMTENRMQSRKGKKALSEKDISNGPSKLCQALRVDRSMDQLSLTAGKEMWLEEGEKISDDRIVCCERIGLSERSEEWIHKALRFYVFENNCVSVRNKLAEAKLRSSALK